MKITVPRYYQVSHIHTHTIFLVSPVMEVGYLAMERHPHFEV